jgi:hypothetical protein
LSFAVPVPESASPSECFPHHRSGAIQRRRCRTRSAGLVRAGEAGEARLGPPRGHAGCLHVASSRCLSPGNGAIVSHPPRGAEDAHALPLVPFPRDPGRVAELRPVPPWRDCAISLGPCPEGGAPLAPLRIVWPATPPHASDEAEELRRHLDHPPEAGVPLGLKRRRLLIELRPDPRFGWGIGGVREILCVDRVGE